MLNAHYMALRVVSVRRAITMLFKTNLDRDPLAEVIHVEDGQYMSYNFDDWRELSALQREFEPAKYDWIRSVRFQIAVPRIIGLLGYDRLPRHDVKFNRRNVYARDRSQCQYCGRRFTTSELSLDHVGPRSQGGKASWTNVVASCLKCNVKKGGRTPAQAHMHLLREPVKPRRSPVISIKLADSRYHSWKQFLNNAYWNVELK